MCQSVCVCTRATVAWFGSNLKWNCRGPVTRTPIFHFQSITGQFMTSMCCARIFVHNAFFASPCTARCIEWLNEWKGTNSTTWNFIKSHVERENTKKKNCILNLIAYDWKVAKWRVDCLFFLFETVFFVVVPSPCIFAYSFLFCFGRILILSLLLVKLFDMNLHLLIQKMCKWLETKRKENCHIRSLVAILSNWNIE